MHLDMEIRTTSALSPEPLLTPPVSGHELPEPPHNFRITDAHLGEGGAKTRFPANTNLVSDIILHRIEAF